MPKRNRRQRKRLAYNADFDGRREHRGRRRRRRGQRPSATKHNGSPHRRRRCMKPSVWEAAKRKAEMCRNRAKQRNLKMSFHDFRAESDQEMEDHVELEMELLFNNDFHHADMVNHELQRTNPAEERARQTLETYRLQLSPSRVNDLAGLYTKILRLEDEEKEAQEYGAFNRVLIQLHSKRIALEDMVDSFIVTYIREDTRGQCTCDYGTLGITICPYTIISF